MLVASWWSMRSTGSHPMSPWTRLWCAQCLQPRSRLADQPGISTLVCGSAFASNLGASTDPRGAGGERQRAARGGYRGSGLRQPGQAAQQASPGLGWRMLGQLRGEGCGDVNTRMDFGKVRFMSCRCFLFPSATLFRCLIS